MNPTCKDATTKQNNGIYTYRDSSEIRFLGSFENKIIDISSDCRVEEMVKLLQPACSWYGPILQLCRGRVESNCSHPYCIVHKGCLSQGFTARVAKAL